MGVYLGVGACLGYYSTFKQVYANNILGKCPCGAKWQGSAIWALNVRPWWYTLSHILPTLVALLFVLYLSSFVHACNVQNPIQQYTCHDIFIASDSRESRHLLSHSL